MIQGQDWVQWCKHRVQYVHSVRVCGHLAAEWPFMKFWACMCRALLGMSFMESLEISVSDPNWRQPLDVVISAVNVPEEDIITNHTWVHSAKCSFSYLKKYSVLFLNSLTYTISFFLLGISIYMQTQIIYLCSQLVTVEFSGTNGFTSWKLFLSPSPSQPCSFLFTSCHGPSFAVHSLTIPGAISPRNS